MRRFITSKQWIEHYRTNAKNQLPIDWSDGVMLSESEARAVVKSLQAWQLGETSSGENLLKATRRYAAMIADPDFVTVMQLFIDEENRHGELLGQFLDRQGTTRIRRNWGDSVFRRMRGWLLSMEVWTTVVITVETLALVYYRAILNATSSSVLRKICTQLLKDEVHHLRMQYERLAQMHVGRGHWMRVLTRAVHRVVFFGTWCAVWISHHRALCVGGYPMRRFWQVACKRMNFHWRRMNPAIWSFEVQGQHHLTINGNATMENNGPHSEEPCELEFTI